MNSKDLLKVIGDIDDKYLFQETDTKETNQLQSNKVMNIIKTSKFKYILAPVCLIIISAIIVIKIGLFDGNTPNLNNQDWKIKKVYLDETTLTYDIATASTWEERTITDKFYVVDYLDTTYNPSAGTKISSDKIEKEIDTVTLTSYDEYAGEYHNIGATIYKTTDFPTECVIAVQFDGDTNYYIYINCYYRPATLGEFMEDLKLKELASFGTVYFDYFYTDSNGKGQYVMVEFYDVDDEVIWDMLFNDFSLENIYSDTETYWNDHYTQGISISVNIPLLGIENHSISLTNKGYLITNILETGKGFYIGEDNVQTFIDYIIEHYDGYKIVYVDENGNEISDGEEGNLVDEEKIMMIDNTTQETTVVNIVTTNENKTNSSEN